MNSWPPHMAGVCYTREIGWFRPRRRPDGSVLREPISPDEIADAGLPEHPKLDEWTRTLVLHPQPLQNLIPRRQA